MFEQTQYRPSQQKDVRQAQHRIIVPETAKQSKEDELRFHDIGNGRALQSSKAYREKSNTNQKQDRQNCEVNAQTKT